MKINVLTSTTKTEAELNSSKSAKIFFDSLPITGRANTWGREIYFEIPLELKEEDGFMKQEMENGDLAYWPPGNAFCIFFGKTPSSKSEKPMAASKVIWLGKIKGDIEIFKSIGDGEEIILEMSE